MPHDDVPVTPGYPQGRPLQVCPTCRMKAPIRACGCVLCDVLGLRPVAPNVTPGRKERRKR